MKQVRIWDDVKVAYDVRGKLLLGGERRSKKDVLGLTTHWVVTYWNGNSRLTMERKRCSLEEMLKSCEGWYKIPSGDPWHYCQKNSWDVSTSDGIFPECFLTATIKTAYGKIEVCGDVSHAEL